MVLGVVASLTQPRRWFLGRRCLFTSSRRRLTRTSLSRSSGKGGASNVVVKVGDKKIPHEFECENPCIDYYAAIRIGGLATTPVRSFFTRGEGPHDSEQTPMKADVFAAVVKKTVDGLIKANGRVRSASVFRRSRRGKCSQKWPSKEVRW